MSSRSLLGGFLGKAILWLLRVYAYFFQLALCLFLLGLGIAGGASLKLDLLPWTGASLTRALLIMGAVGILSCLLAMLGRLRWIFPLWNLFVFVMIFRGFFLTAHSFGGAAEFKFAVWLTAGALLAFLGSLSLFGRRR